MDADFILAIERQAAALDQLDYFEVLGIGHEADAPAVKAAYHRASRACHPDRYAALPSPELREVIARVYRRVTEAYTVLRDDARRARYRADVTGPGRLTKLRFTEAEEVAIQSQRKQRLDEQLGRTVPGRKLYATAFQDAEAGRWAAAERGIKTALVYEPDNPRFRELLARIERSRPRADPFKIS
jgi:DnaJ-class molecular chaperone